MDSQFEFYEIVRIKRTDFTVQNGLNGLQGVILGKSADEVGNWFYSVDIFDLEDGWDLPEKCLESTGEFSSKKDFYDGTSIKVKVDPKTGEGDIMD